MFIIVTVMIEIYVFGGNQGQDAVETVVHPTHRRLLAPDRQL